jgi:hypothetical protein
LRFHYNAFAVLENARYAILKTRYTSVARKLENKSNLIHNPSRRAME